MSKNFRDIGKRLTIAGVGRFQVMALLQAARYYLVHGDLDKAKSFGLNRAIFYAWAKYYGPHTQQWRRARLEEILRRGVVRERKTKCPEGMVEVLGECVEESPRGYYVISGREQSPREYDEKIVGKINKVIDYNRVWSVAIDYVREFPEWILRDQQKFYKVVYEPVRVTFFKEILQGRKPRPSQWLLDKIKSLEKTYIESRKKQKTLFEY